MQEENEKRREEEMPIRSLFKLRLAERELEEDRKIPLEEVSSATGVSVNSLSGYRANRVQRFDGWVLGALCRYFNCKLEDLLIYMPDGDGKTKEAS
jgi:putative transcriptional regulator